MTINNLKQSFVRQLEKACQTLSIELTEAKQDQILEYLTQLLKWNKTYNLTAIRDPEQALVQHIFDSLAVITPIRSYSQSKQENTKTVLDVGSGAGLPGVVIAIILPEIQVTCVDTVEKKMAFVRQVSGVLALTNLTAIHQRVELMNEGSYDIVVSRAFASLEDFAELAGKKAKEDGILLAMKGKIPHEEIVTLEEKTDWCVKSIEGLEVPQLSAQRCLVWMKRKGTQ
jgi:16S rRNA (guanine527-N7)-methyltransferase